MRQPSNRSPENYGLRQLKRANSCFRFTPLSCDCKLISKKDLGWISDKSQRYNVGGPSIWKNGYHKNFQTLKICRMLEISAILRFKNIWDYQKIYAIIYDFLFIAVMLTLLLCCVNLILFILFFLSYSLKIIKNPFNSFNSLFIRLRSWYFVLGLYKVMFREEKSLPYDGH